MQPFKLLRASAISAALLLTSCGTEDPSHGAARQIDLVELERTPEGTLSLSNGLKVTSYTAGKESAVWNDKGLKLKIYSPRNVRGKVSISFRTKNEDKETKKHVVSPTMKTFRLYEDLRNDGKATFTIPTEEIDAFLNEHKLVKDDVELVIRLKGNMDGVFDPIATSMRLKYFDKAEGLFELHRVNKNPDAHKRCELDHDESRPTVDVVSDGKGGTTIEVGTETVSVEDGHVDFDIVDAHTLAISSSPDSWDAKLSGELTISDEDEKLVVELRNIPGDKPQMLYILNDNQLSLDSIRAKLEFSGDGSGSCTVR